MRNAVTRLAATLLVITLAGCPGAQSHEREPSAPIAVERVPAQADQLPEVTDPPIAGSLPHDPQAFTQGLLYLEGSLFEGTGRNGESRVRQLKAENGEVEREVPLSENFFGEGLAYLDGSFYQLTWTSGVCLVYNRDLELQKQLLYGNQGWGLTVEPDSKQLIFSDGSSTLKFLNPENLITERRVRVTDGLGNEVRQLNELEWVQGEIWANVWMSDVICRIDPANGKALGWVRLETLVKENQTSNEDVLNGIAYDPEGDTLWVTGKLWSKIYRIDKVSEVFFKP